MNLICNDADALSRVVIATRAQSAAMTNRLAGCYASDAALVRVRNALHVATREAEDALIQCAKRAERGDA